MGKVLVKVRVWEFSVQGLVKIRSSRPFQRPSFEVLGPLLDSAAIFFKGPRRQGSQRRPVPG